MSASCYIVIFECSLSGWQIDYALFSSVEFIVQKGVIMNGYIKVSEASKLWEISNRRIITLCNEGRIDGAVKFGNTWAIPCDSQKPRHERIKTGKYVKNKAQEQ